MPLSEEEISSSSELSRKLRLGLCAKLLVNLHVLTSLHIAVHLVEIKVAVDRVLLRAQFRIMLLVLLWSWKPPQNGGNRGKLRGGKVHIRALTQAVWKVTCGGRHDSAVVGNASLITHAQRATWHLCARTNVAVGSIQTLRSQLLLVHLGWRHNPELREQLTLYALQ